MVLFTGATVEEAIQTGLTRLGLTRSQAQITILAKEKKGFLGFGKKLAQVELEALVSKEPSPDKKGQELAVSPLKQDVQSKKDPEQIRPSAEVVEVEIPETIRVSPILQDDFAAFVAQEFQSSRPSLEDVSVEISSYVERIIQGMDLEATITPRFGRRHITLQIETTEPGRIIGYHGKVLKSLQILAQNVLHDRYSRNFSVTINVRDYLENRTETLIDFATKAAHRVLDTGKDYRLEPMTNQERKIIHKTVSRISGVESYSEGEDPDRYVVIVARN